MPLVDRIAALRMPISFICTCLSLYALLSRLLRFHTDGEYDWMDPVGGMTSIDNLKAAGNENARMYIVPRAGHHGKPLLASLVVRATSSDLVLIDSVLGQRKSGE